MLTRLLTAAIVPFLFSPWLAQAEDKSPRVDLYGDPLPEGAVARLGTVRLRHGGWRPAMYFTADTKSLVTANEDGMVRFWEVASGKLLRAMKVSEQMLQTIVPSPDGKTLAAGGYKGVALWDLESGKEVQQLKAGSVRSLAFSPDGKSLVSGGSDNDSTARVWDLATGQERRRMKWHQREVSRVLVASDGQTLISASSADRKAQFANLATGEEIRAIVDRNWTDLETVLLSPDGKSMLLGGASWRREAKSTEGFLRLYEVATGLQIRNFEETEKGVTGAVLTPDGKMLIASSRDGPVGVWDVATGKRLRQFDAPGKVMALSPDGKTLALMGRDVEIHLVDVATGKPLHQYVGHGGYIRSLVFSSDGKVLASASADERSVRFWDTTTSKQLRTSGGHDRDFLWQIARTPDGKEVVSSGSDGAIRFWDSATGKETRKFSFLDLPGPEEEGVIKGWRSVQSFAISADGTQLVAFSPKPGDGFGKSPAHVRSWNLATGKQLAQHEMTGHFDFRPIAFAADGKIMAHINDKGGVLLQDTVTLKELAVLKAPDIFENPLFSPDGKLVAGRASRQQHEANRFWRDNYAIRVYDWASGKEVLHIATDGWMQPLTFSPDGRSLASTGQKSIQLWEVATGKERWRSPDLDARPSALGFSPDGRRLACGFNDSTILIWDLTTVDAK